MRNGFRRSQVLVSLAAALSAGVSPGSARADPLSVGAAFEWSRGQLTNGVTATLFVALPLERMAAPSLARETLVFGRAALAEGPHGEAPDGDEKPPPEPAPQKRKPAPAAVDSRFVRRLVQAALLVRAEPSARARLEGLSARVRASAALPELTLRALRSTDQSLKLSPTGSYVYDYTQTGGAGVILEARATWKLDRLVFAEEELRVERLRMQRERADERLIALVLKHVFSWQRARARLKDEELLPDERLALEVDVLDAEAALDVLTGGLFGAERAALDAAEKARPEPPEPVR